MTSALGHEILTSSGQIEARQQKEIEMKRDSFTEFANSLTSEQYLKLVEFSHGPVPEEFKNMTDNELLSELEGLK